MQTIKIDSAVYHQIDNCTGYHISVNGDVYSTKSKKLLKRHKKSKYEFVTLSIEGKIKIKSVHRLVAMAFIPNPDKKREVNHKDCDKSNNRVENLEWCTHAENMKHAVENGRFNWIRSNSNLGRDMTIIARKRMSEAKIGIKHPKFKGYTITPFGKFESSYDAGRVEGISKTYILKRIKDCNYPDYYIELIES